MEAARREGLSLSRVSGDALSKTSRESAFGPRGEPKGPRQVAARKRLKELEKEGYFEPKRDGGYGGSADALEERLRQAEERKSQAEETADEVVIDDLDAMNLRELRDEAGRLVAAGLLPNKSGNKGKLIRNIRGSRLEEAKQLIPGVRGREADLELPSGRSIRVTYRFVEADDSEP